MNRFYISLSSLLLCAPAIFAGNSGLPPVKMTISPVKSTETDQQIRFLPKEDELKEGDAVPLYEQAAKSLDSYYPEQKFSAWRSLSPQQLPVQEVESELNNLKPTLDILGKAAKCKDCNWPKLTLQQARQQTIDLAKFRRLAFILDVQAKIQLQQGQYDKAIETIKTGLTMSKHLGEAPTITQVLVAIAIASLNFERVEQFMQADNAPGLQAAMQNLPQPFIDIDKAIKYENDNFVTSNSLMNILTRNQTRQQLQPAFDRSRVIMNHLDRRIAALQIIGALRLYAGTHEGKLPEKLSDITDLKIPDDPVTKKPFEYKSTGSKATLAIEGTEGSDGRDSVHYEIKIKE